MKTFREFRIEKGIDLKTCNGEQLEALMLEYIQYKVGKENVVTQFNDNGHLIAKVLCEK